MVRQGAVASAQALSHTLWAEARPSQPGQVGGGQLVPTWTWPLGVNTGSHACLLSGPPPLGRPTWLNQKDDTVPAAGGGARERTKNGQRLRTQTPPSHLTAPLGGTWESFRASPSGGSTLEISGRAATPTLPAHPGHLPPHAPMQCWVQAPSELTKLRLPEPLGTDARSGPVAP